MNNNILIQLDSICACATLQVAWLATLWLQLPRQLPLYALVWGERPSVKTPLALAFCASWSVPVVLSNFVMSWQMTFWFNPWETWELRVQTNTHTQTSFCAEKTDTDTRATNFCRFCFVQAHGYRPPTHPHLKDRKSPMVWLITRLSYGKFPWRPCEAP